MKLEPENIPTKKPRKQKEALDSRVFKDGQIYLYRRQDYKKPIWYFVGWDLCKYENAVASVK